jgi:hypothetical protein
MSITIMVFSKEKQPSADDFGEYLKYIECVQGKKTSGTLYSAESAGGFAPFYSAIFKYNVENIDQAALQCIFLRSETDDFDLRDPGTKLRENSSPDMSTLISTLDKVEKAVRGELATTSLWSLTGHVTFQIECDLTDFSEMFSGRIRGTFKSV